MSEYTDAWALEMQALACEGDEAACWSLVNLLRPCVLLHCGDSTLERCLWDDVWSDCIAKLAALAASGNTIGRWFAYAKVTVRNMVNHHVRQACRKRNAEEEYMTRVHVRFTEAYPAVRDCVDALQCEEHDLIVRMYFRPVRQSVLEISKEMCCSYWRIQQMHKRTLCRLRYMLEEQGVCHA